MLNVPRECLRMQEMVGDNAGSSHNTRPFQLAMRSFNKISLSTPLNLSGSLIKNIKDFKNLFLLFCFSLLFYYDFFGFLFSGFLYYSYRWSFLLIALIALMFYNALKHVKYNWIKVIVICATFIIISLSFFYECSL